MQEAIPYRIWRHAPPSTYQTAVRTPTRSGSIRVINGGLRVDLKRLVKENAVIVFARRGCCMYHVVKILLQSVGANHAVYEVEEKDEDDIRGELQKADDGCIRKDGHFQFPAVFISGRWFGGLDRIIATHITEELTPLLKQAGALWL
ncbi:Glutaredoxin [Handroanthus impetiginosus]|uniref:Glutaredoxin n=1 Tax=Handroanthus impetiginosus TaxID=429701 RepID=A0A2G9FWR2_9LAMI|nr:Glutaredoxin [Handroanthus impetiginosus]